MDEERILNIIDCLDNDVYDSNSRIGKAALKQIRCYIKQLQRDKQIMLHNYNKHIREYDDEIERYRIILDKLDDFIIEKKRESLNNINSYIAYATVLEKMKKLEEGIFK